MRTGGLLSVTITVVTLQLDCALLIHFPRARSGDIVRQLFIITLCAGLLHSAT